MTPTSPAAPDWGSPECEAESVGSPAAPQGSNDEEKATDFPRGLGQGFATVELLGDLYERRICTSDPPPHSWPLLLALRESKLDQMGYAPSDYLHFASVQQVIREYRVRWLGEADTGAKVAELQSRCKTTNAQTRTLHSNFRTALYERFGGLPWVQWFVAIGDLPEDLFSLAAEYNLAKVREANREPRRENTPHPCPKLAPRAQAASLGQPLPDKQGVQHYLTQAKKARKQARYVSSQVEAAEAAWSAGTSTMRWWEWDRLLRKQQDTPTSMLEIDPPGVGGYILSMMCIYICIYTCFGICIYIYIYICIYASAYIHI